MQEITKWIVKPLVPEEVYTDRKEFLDYFYRAALNASKRRTMSTVLLGQRRMGKTEIFKRVVNRLFFEQNPENHDAVIPVYYSFSDAAMDEKSFAKEYLENFIRYYAGFKTGRPEFVTHAPKEDELVSMLEEAKSSNPFTQTLDLLLKWHKAIMKQDVYLPQKDAVEIPRRVADLDDTTIAVFLDEFQNTRLPQYDFEITGFMKEAVESPNCPHFVTGSALGILSKEIIGKGALFGRFDSEEIGGMTGYHGADLARKAARYYAAELDEMIAPMVAEKCGGNPFYITAVIRQAAKSAKPIKDEKTLNEILAVDITSGFIWGELNDQVSRWIERINDRNITKWILYLSALDENEENENRDRLNIEKIRQELKKREGTDVPLETIREVLIRLSRGDLLEYLELGDWFRRVKDPILLEFLKIWGRIEVEGHDRISVREDLRKEIHHRYDKKSLDEYKGYLAEVHMSQILLSARNMTLKGDFFHAETDIAIPDFTFVRHRVRLGSGPGRKIDLLGGAGIEQWVCQSKFVKNKKIGVSVLREMVAQAEAVKEEKRPDIVRMWLFVYNGLTRSAEIFAKEKEILWSSGKELNALLSYLGLRSLPDL